MSVVIPHYGDPRLAQALVDQLQEPCVREIVVVDDASPRPFGSWPGVVTVRRPQNGGFGSAVNSGAAVCTGSFLLILNSDVSLDPGFVAAMLEASAPWQPALTAPMVMTRGLRESTGRLFPLARTQTVEHFGLLARWRDRATIARLAGVDLRPRPGTDTAVDWVAGVGMLVPTHIFRQVGGFDEAFFMYAEEVDLQRRLAAQDIPRVLLGSVSLEHLGGASSDPEKAAGWLLDARLRYANKWGGLARLRLGLTLAAFVNVSVDKVRGRHRRGKLLPYLRQVWRPRRFA